MYGAATYISGRVVPQPQTQRSIRRHFLQQGTQEGIVVGARHVHLPPRIPADHIQVDVQGDAVALHGGILHERLGAAQAELLRIESGENHRVVRSALAEVPRNREQYRRAGCVVVRAVVDDAILDSQVVVVRRDHDHRTVGLLARDVSHHVHRLQRHPATLQLEGLLEGGAKRLQTGLP